MRNKKFVFLKVCFLKTNCARTFSKMFWLLLCIIVTAAKSAGKYSPRTYDK